MNKKYLIIGGLIILLLVFAAALFLTASPNTGPSDEKIELVWWRTFEDSENVRELITDYQAAHENVTITFVKKDIVDYEKELVDAIASGKGPDIFSIHNDWLPKHFEKIAPIPDTVMNLRTYKDSFVDVAYSDFVKDNRIYAIPLAVDVLALYYNKDLLGSAGISQPPSTWPELVTDVEKITKVSKTGAFTISGIALGTGANINRSVDILTLMMLQSGTKFYADDLRTARFDQSQSVEGSTQSFNPGAFALTVYTQFANPSVKAYTWNIKSDLGVDAFTQSKVAMMLSYAYMIPVIRAKAPNLNWDVSGAPQISNEVSKVNFANYWGEAVSKNSLKQEAAFDFLNFISSKTELTKYYAKHELVASRKDILPQQVSDTDIGVFAENALTAKSVYKKDANIYEALFLDVIDDVVLNNVKPEDALRKAVQQINLNLR